MKQECESCGTCCRNGGPPLHAEDYTLVACGILSFEDLITVRCGEMVMPPLASEPVVARSEWIKVKGQGNQWCCRFLDLKTNFCAIYKDRPVSCRVLKCWDTDDILAMAGRNLLSRLDLIPSEDPLLPLVELQENNSPVPNLEEVRDTMKEEESGQEVLHYLTGKVQDDLHLRAQAGQEFNLSVASELFYFGRPLFQILYPLGIETLETTQGITLQFHSS